MNSTPDDLIMIEFVKAKPCDAEELAALDSLCFAVPWTLPMFSAEMENKLAYYLLAKIDDKIVGYVGIWKIIDEGHITNVAVHPEYRRMHLATYLLEKIVRLSEKNGISAMTLEVRRSNEAAQRLYEKFGFAVEGERKGYYEDNGEDALIMWRR